MSCDLDQSAKLTSQVNVFELASTYLKLRSLLHLTHRTPEHDPAIYNVHFANALHFGTDASTVAADASRLVRRFKADWMTQGRRPSGICGACLIIAARMSNYLRTVEEVAQVVKCSPTTIRRRLREFAATQMAKKSVKEWREISDTDLDRIGEEEPPVVKQQRLKRAREENERADRERRAQEERDRQAGEDEDDAMDGGEQDEQDEEVNEGDAADREAGDGEDEEVGSSKRRKNNKGKAAATEETETGKGKGKGKGKATVPTTTAKNRGRGKGKTAEGTSAPNYRPLDADEAITQALLDQGMDPEDVAAFNDAGPSARQGDGAGDGIAGQGQDQEEEEEDDNLDEAPLDKVADALDMASDNPKAAQAARMQERMAFKRTNRAATNNSADPSDLAAVAGAGDGDQAPTDTAVDAEGQGTQMDVDRPADTQLRSIHSQFPDPPPYSLLPPPPTVAPPPFVSSNFHTWNDEAQTLDHFFKSYFSSDPDLVGLTEAHMRERILKWMSNGRDPQVVAQELWAIETARKRADREMRTTRERVILGVDEHELDGIIGMEHGEKQMRAETWLAKHSRWMEQEKGEYPCLPCRLIGKFAGRVDDGRDHTSEHNG